MVIYKNNCRTFSSKYPNSLFHRCGRGWTNINFRQEYTSFEWNSLDIANEWENFFNYRNDIYLDYENQLVQFEDNRRLPTSSKKEHLLLHPNANIEQMIFLDWYFERKHRHTLYNSALGNPCSDIDSIVVNWCICSFWSRRNGWGQ